MADEKPIWTDMNTSRARVTDLVFNHLAQAILRGQLAPGEALPAERDLAERYSVSRVLVREAVHKLKELGLLRVKQGGQTIVLDPALASDPRLLSLELELEGATPALRTELSEKLLTHVLSLLEVAHGRFDEDSLKSLGADAAEIDAAPEEARGPVVTRFWLTIAASTKNRLLRRETRFWLDLAERIGALRCLTMLGEHFYVRLVTQLRAGKHASNMMLDRLRPAMDR